MSSGRCMMWYLDSKECRYCGTPFTLYAVKTRDHIIPLSRGGKSGYPNKAASCILCNNAKSNLLPSEFLEVIEKSYKEKKQYKGLEVEVMPNIIRNLKLIFIPKEKQPEHLSADAKRLYVETRNR